MPILEYDGDKPINCMLCHKDIIYGAKYIIRIDCDIKKDACLSIK